VAFFMAWAVRQVPRTFSKIACFKIADNNM
jgi:hypothetical protein